MSRIKIEAGNVAQDQINELTARVNGLTAERNTLQSTLDTALDKLAKVTRDLTLAELTVRTRSALLDDARARLGALEWVVKTQAFPPAVVAQVPQDHQCMTVENR